MRSNTSLYGTFTYNLDTVRLNLNNQTDPQKRTQKDEQVDVESNT